MDTLKKRRNKKVILSKKRKLFKGGSSQSIFSFTLENLYKKINKLDDIYDNIIEKLVSICSLFVDLSFHITLIILVQITYFLFIEPKIFLFPNIPVFGIGNHSPGSERSQNIKSGVVLSCFIVTFLGSIVFLPILMIILIIKYYKKDFIILNKYLKTFILLFLFSKLGITIIYAGFDKIKDMFISLKTKIQEYQSTPIKVIDLKPVSKPKMNYSFKNKDPLNIGLLSYLGIDRKKSPQKLEDTSWRHKINKFQNSILSKISKKEDCSSELVNSKLELKKLIPKFFFQTKKDQTPNNNLKKTQGGNVKFRFEEIITILQCLFRDLREDLNKFLIIIIDKYLSILNEKKYSHQIVFLSFIYKIMVPLLILGCFYLLSNIKKNKHLFQKDMLLSKKN